MVSEAGTNADRRSRRNHDGDPAAEQAVAAVDRRRGPSDGDLVPRRRGLRPGLLAAMVRAKAAERRSPLNGRSFGGHEASVRGCSPCCLVRFSRRAYSEACDRSGRGSVNCGRESPGGLGTERPSASSGGTDRGDSISTREARLRVQARQSLHGGSGSRVRVFQATGGVARWRTESARLGGFAGAVS